ncbi:MAG: 30S ribosomal protein S20 [Myxococcales bacterium]|nr:30S ribosomal protein S20 [Myxococcales bacterium]MCB9641924.1 30S ribosomal protein S20 [Myxococcales bacterium]
MANCKSALKRLRQNAKRRARNRYWKSTMRTAVKKVRKAVGDGNVEAAKTNLGAAVKLIGHVCSKGVIHKNTASRQISRLMKLVNRAEA